MLFDTLLLFSNLFRSALMYFATTSRSSDQASPLATLLFGMRSIDNRTSSVSENISSTDVMSTLLLYCFLYIMSTLDHCVCVIEFCGFFARAYLLTGSWEQLSFFC